MVVLEPGGTGWEESERNHRLPLLLFLKIPVLELSGDLVERRVGVGTNMLFLGDISEHH